MLALAAATMLACSPAPATPPSPKLAGPTHCHYQVALVNADTGQLEVEARCEGGSVHGWIANEAAIAPLVSASHASGALERQGNRFALADAAAANSIRYRVNLDAAAYQTADIDVAYKAGTAWVSAASTWLLQPEPLRAETRATIAVTTPPGSGFTSGMLRDEAGHYTVLARRIHSATYGVFGTFREATVEVPGPFSSGAASAPKSRIQLVVVPGELSLSMDELRGWLREAAAAVGDFWGGFPVESVCAVVIPTPGRDKVVHGKVVSAGGPTIVLRVGADLEVDRVRDDWILVHEFFHLGFPTFPHANKWLDEGLATYYEPIIRTRAGWRSEEDLWQELAYDMPQGLAAMEKQGLDNSQDFRDIYWGGATLAFLADVRIRQRSQHRLGLEDGLRAVLARGGRAGSIWTVDKAVAIVDEEVGMPVFSELVAAHRKKGSPVGFDELLRQLGVSRSEDGVVIDDSAALAPLRRLLVSPSGATTAPQAAAKPKAAAN